MTTSKLSAFVNSIALTVLLFSNFSSATEPWQFAQGPHFGFVIPDRPVGSTGAYFTVLMHKVDRHVSPGITIEEAKRICPISATIIQKIFNRIVLKNDLRKFINDGPGIFLDVDCYSQDTPHSELDEVYIPANVLQAETSEDEVAYIIAHEMSHVLFGHTEKLLDLETLEMKLGDENKALQQRVLKTTQESEAQADHYGGILVWNAGYNPSCLKKSLLNYEKLYQGFFMRFLSQYVFDDGHGSNRERQARVKNRFLEPANLSVKCNVAKSVEIERARKELNRLSATR